MKINFQPPTLEIPDFCAMKRFFRILIFACLTLNLFSCKTDNRQVTADMINFPQSASGTNTDNLPAITFDEAHFNFGKIAIGEKLSHVFHFTNTGKSPLLIMEVHPTCGCTVAKDWPKTPIAPGEGGDISIDFDSKGFPGKIEKTITVLTNAFPKVTDIKLLGEVSGLEGEQPTEPKE
jgi:hypothetical protein